MYDAKFMPNLCAGALVLVVLLLVGNCGDCCGICGGVVVVVAVAEVGWRSLETCVTELSLTTAGYLRM